MGRLLNVAFRNSKYRLLMGVTLIFICLLTIASQLEIFALGVITRKGPDFFELFAPEKGNVLQKTEQITKTELESRWQQLDPAQKGYVTLSDTTEFIAAKKKNDFIDRALNWFQSIFPITGNLTNLAIGLFFVALFKAVTLFAHRFCTKLIGISISRDLRQEYFQHIQSLPMEFYNKHNIGGLASRVVGDASQIAEAINACLTNYIQTPFTILTTLTICFFASWQLSIFIFLGFPAIVGPIFFLARHIKRITKQIQKNQENFTTVLIDFLAGIQTVKVFAMENFSMRKYKEHNEKMAQLEMKSARYDVSSRPIIHTIGMGFVSATMIYGLYFLQMSVSDVFFFCGLLYIFYEPFKKFAEENSHIQRGITAAERMYEVIETQPQIIDQQGAGELQNFKDLIEFDNVWFRYGEHWVLKGISFTVKKGQTVAIVGPTGAGKSTIVQLLPRLYDVQQGEIRIDGKAIKTYTQKSLRENIAFVPQKPFLFLDTIADNISYGRPLAMEQIQAAAQKAHAAEFIERLPEGYQTQLSESGKNFSGGQQQRLAIARALAKNAPILVMDEATSSLDSVSENQIKNAIHLLRGQMTQIIIAHRLSTIEDADKIIYLEGGQKIAEGTKDELLKNCTGFRKMWDMMHMSHTY